MAQSAPAAAVSNIYNTPELRDKIVFTFICLVIYRIGAHITAPGVDVVALTDLFANKGKGGLLGLYDLFVGGGLSHATVFGLGIMPYISSRIFFPIVERFWPGIFGTFGFIKTQAVGPFSLVVLGIVMVGVVAGTIAITIAARRVMIQIPQRTMARGRQREAAKNFIPLRINAAGVMPIIFASSVIVVPGAIAQFSGSPIASQWAEKVAPGTWPYYLLQTILIVFFTYFYTSIIFNPVDISENLKKQGGFIPGVKPGARTAEYIDHVVSRITFPAALFLTFIALLPVFIADAVNVPS